MFLKTRSIKLSAHGTNLILNDTTMYFLAQFVMAAQVRCSFFGLQISYLQNTVCLGLYRWIFKAGRERMHSPTFKRTWPTFRPSQLYESMAIQNHPCILTESPHCRQANCLRCSILTIQSLLTSQIAVLHWCESDIRKLLRRDTLVQIFSTGVAVKWNILLPSLFPCCESLLKCVWKNHYFFPNY